MMPEFIFAVALPDVHVARRLRYADAVTKDLRYFELT